MIHVLLSEAGGDQAGHLDVLGEDQHRLLLGVPVLRKIEGFRLGMQARSRADSASGRSGSTA
ncbi:hypothetical protein ABZ509_20175, partial [Streptomyces lavendulocolor]